MNSRRRIDAIAYRRVSTERQAESGVGLECQSVAIETYADQAGYRVIGRYQDVGTGRGKHNLINRSGLQLAIKVAEATGCPIIVSDLCRISREVESIDELVGQHKITIISAGDGIMRDPYMVSAAAARAQRQGELISQRTKQGLARKKAEGVLLGNRKNLPEAQRLGVEKIKEMAEEKVDQIVAVLDDLGARDFTTQELVDILNEKGIRTNRQLPWTVAAIRRPLKAAREKIRIRDTEQQDLEERRRQHPLFGRF